MLLTGGGVFIEAVLLCVCLWIIFVRWFLPKYFLSIFSPGCEIRGVFIFAERYRIYIPILGREVKVGIFVSLWYEEAQEVFGFVNCRSAVTRGDYYRNTVFQIYGIFSLFCRRYFL